MKLIKPKKPLISDIGNITKNIATKVMENDELKGKMFSFAQQKMPKIDLENFSDISERVLSDLKRIQLNEHATEDALNKAAQLEIYQKFFKGKRIVVDDFFISIC